MDCKIAGLTLALLLAMTGNLRAQLIDLPGGSFSSPQSTATQGRIRSMADDALRPDGYRQYTPPTGLVNGKKPYRSGNKTVCGY